MPPKVEPKKPKFMRNDLDKMEMKEYQRKKEIGKKTKLPKGVFENTGSKDSKLKSSTKMHSDMKHKLDMYEKKKDKHESSDSTKSKRFPRKSKK